MKILMSSFFKIDILTPGPSLILTGSLKCHQNIPTFGLTTHMCDHVSLQNCSVTRTSLLDSPINNQDGMPYQEDPEKQLVRVHNFAASAQL